MIVVYTVDRNQGHVVINLHPDNYQDLETLRSLRKGEYTYSVVFY